MLIMGIFKKKEKDPAVTMRLSALEVLRKSMDENPDFAKAVIDGTIMLARARKNEE